MREKRVEEPQLENPNIYCLYEPQNVWSARRIISFGCPLLGVRNVAKSIKKEVNLLLDINLL